MGQLSASDTEEEKDVVAALHKAVEDTTGWKPPARKKKLTTIGFIQ